MMIITTRHVLHSCCESYGITQRLSGVSCHLFACLLADLAVCYGGLLLFLPPRGPASEPSVVTSNKTTPYAADL